MANAAKQSGAQQRAKRALERERKLEDAARATAAELGALLNLEHVDVSFGEVTSGQEAFLVTIPISEAEVAVKRVKALINEARFEEQREAER